MDRSSMSRRDLIAGTLAAGGYFLLRRSYRGLAFAETPAYRVAPVTAPAVISGTVSYKGRVPKPVMKQITQDFQVAGRTPRVWEGLNLGGNAIKDAVVIINGVSQGKAFTEKRNLAYAKGATILERTDIVSYTGPETVLGVENRDPILHTWILYLKPQQLTNLAHVAGAPPVKMRFKTPGLSELRCAPHQWERAVRMVVPHPYHTKTDAQGRFTISDVPSGRYNAVIWAEGFMPLTLPLEVSGAKVTLSPTMQETQLTDALKANL